MGTELDELIDFLSSPSPQVKKAAVDIVRDLTGSEETIASLSTRADAAVRALTTLLRENTTPQVSVAAAQALVNLSQNTSLSQKIVDHGTVKVAMDVLYYKSNVEAEIARLLVMLLVNVTQLDSGVNALLQIGDDKLEGLYISKLVRSFSRTSDDAISGVDPFEHVGSILVNISKIEEGRKVLLDSRRNLIKQIFPQFESSSLLRKKGEAGRKAFWCVNGPRILEVGYADEEDPGVMEAYERVGSLLVT